MTPNYDTTDEIYHSTECLTIQRYSHLSTYEARNETPPNSNRCALCKLGVTKETEMYAPVSVELMELYFEDNDWSESQVMTAARTLISETRDKLHEQGHIGKHTGVSVKPISHWKSLRRSARPVHRFDKRFSDAIEVNLIFDIIHRMKFEYAEVGDYIDECASGDIGTGTDQNIAKAVQWLQKYDPPSVLEDVNRVLEEHNNTGNPEDEKAEASSSVGSPTAKTIEQPATSGKSNENQSSLSAFGSG